MIFTLSTAQELIQELHDRGKTIVGDDHSFEKTIRLVEHGPWTIILTTSNTFSLFENKMAVFTILVKDPTHDVSDLLVRAYERDPHSSDLFEYL